MSLEMTIECVFDLRMAMENLKRQAICMHACPQAQHSVPSFCGLIEPALSWSWSVAGLDTAGS